MLFDYNDVNFDALQSLIKWYTIFENSIKIE